MQFARYTEVARQPAVFRDLAIWAPVTLKLQDLLDTLENNQQDGQFLDIIKDIALFDVWKDPNSQQQERSLALRFTLQDPAATLEDTRVDQCMNAALELLVQKHGVRKR
ncbi:phenylalanine--tRNA ligase subunit beta-related protein [Advenella kashmirensis]|uniref:phenylalanine--tRNA ligase subunit beta-related protein n=1 Tax=Advenella kashmirensis TaxID=310575 RepID=UPI003899333B